MATNNVHDNGRRYADKDGSYILPNDSEEHERLETQSDTFIALMNGKPFHAPLTNPKRILDIGCGTGVMTIRLAQKYPDAEVIGLDISPVPALHEQPANVTFIQGDIMDLAKSNDPRFQPGSFDYIFHRLLVLGMTDWPGYVSTVASLLGPGGWAEMQDLDLNVRNSSGASLSDNWWFYGRLRADCEAMGLDMGVGEKLTSLLENTGAFKNIDASVYKIPASVKDDSADGLVAKQHLEKSMAMNRSLVNRVCGGRRSAEEIEEIMGGVKEELMALKEGDHYRIFAAVGRKI